MNGTIHPSMNTKMKLIGAGTVVLVAGGLLLASVAAAQGKPARTASSTAARVEARTEQAQTRAGTEIDARIERLNALMSRVEGMKKIAPSDQSSLTADLESEIASLTALKGKIASDTGTTTLREDVQSITKDYRIYALVVPQASITAAADRALNIVAAFQTVSGKLEARIASSTAVAGASLSPLVSDMNAKVSDAATQAEAAITAVAGLKPDNGDQTVMQSNTSTLKDARAKVEAAMQDLKAARQDAGSVVKALQGERPASAASSSSTGK